MSSYGGLPIQQSTWWGASFGLPNPVDTQKTKMEAEKTAINQAAQQKFDTAQSKLNNNIALSKELEARGVKDRGLLTRAAELGYAQNKMQGNSTAVQRAQTDRKRLLQDSGQNVSTLDAPQLAQPRPQNSERARLRPRRRQVGE